MEPLGDTNFGNCTECVLTTGEYSTTIMGRVSDNLFFDLWHWNFSFIDCPGQTLI